VTTPSFDEVIHAPNRLQTCAMLAPVDALDFAAVRDALGVSDSALSKHLRVLVDSGYVHTVKTRHGSRNRTWLSLTDDGRSALEAHLAELRRIAEVTVAGHQADGAPGDSVRPV
jgi:DNA-binding MarR family transcriptional regulator